MPVYPDVQKRKDEKHWFLFFEHYIQQADKDNSRSEWGGYSVLVKHKGLF